MRSLVTTVLFLLAASAGAQAVDWTRTAPSLDQLNAQILDWNVEYQRLAPGGSAALAALAELHFKRGPVVASGMGSLLSAWQSVAETQKKSRYLAVARYFATHLDDWGTSVAWRWYDCFAPPLDERYNMLSDSEGHAAVSIAAAPPVPSDQSQQLVDRTLSMIDSFVAAYGYPIVDTPLTRFSFDGRGLLLDGRPPRDRQLLNKTFTYGGTLIGLFGAGL